MRIRPSDVGDHCSYAEREWGNDSPIWYKDADNNFHYIGGCYIQNDGTIILTEENNIKLNGDGTCKINRLHRSTIDYDKYK